MSQFEDQLRAALRREEPSADFADRVLARIEAETSTDRAAVVPFAKRERSHRWLAAAAAAAVVAGSTGLALMLGVAEPVPPLETRFNQDINPPAPPPQVSVPPVSSTAPAVVAPDASDRRAGSRTARQSKIVRRPRVAASRPTRDELADRLRAKEQVLRALAITSGAMNSVQRKVSRQQSEQPTSQRQASRQFSK